jgi:hypothetical protein
MRGFQWLLAATLASGGQVRADDTLATRSQTETHLVGDVRGMFLVRDDDNYFRHTDRFNYDMPSVAGGIMGTLGGEIANRLGLYGEGFYVVDGADRSNARLRLSSGALLGVVKATLVRASADHVSVQLTSVGGFGRYYIRETYVDRDLSPMVYSTVSHSYGGLGGIEASLTAAAFRAVIAYSYHYAPASISDRVRGSVAAGGHEISIGIGVSL